MTRTMMDPSGTTPETSRWLHRLAVLTVCAALPLLVLGSLVTTLRAGMADRKWPSQPLYLFTGDVAGDAQQSGYAPSLYVLEHAHRFAGWVVGFLSVALCVSLWIAERRLWLRWVGTGAMLAVGVQGFLGGGRVLLNDWLGTDLATTHGCVAQLVFALLVSVALFTSSWWRAALARSRSRRLPAWALGVSGLVFVQIIFGAIVRHSYLRLAQRLHFLLAFAVLAAVLWLLLIVREEAAGDRRFWWTGHFLAVVLVLQLSLGVEAWMMRFGSGELPEMQRVMALGPALVRTLHFACGTLLFASTVVLTLLARQQSPRPVAVSSPRRQEVLEGVA
jgi:cytochrome c oxidase assembly protein subunit 15